MLLFFQFKLHYFLIFFFSLERLCNKDITYNGIQIKKGTLVGVSTHALHYSEDYYTDPETFDPDRYLSNWTAPNCNLNIMLILNC